jgi:hypothetical protein
VSEDKVVDETTGALPASGTVRVSGRASTLISAERAADADPLLCAGRMDL